MGRRSRQAKQQAALGYAVGLDDLSSSLDFRKKWKDFTEEVKEANKEAAKKSAFTSFVRTAVFYATAVATGGMSMLWHSAATSYAASAAAGLVADEVLYGDIPVPQAPNKKASKFNQARNMEKQQQLETAYGDLAGDIALVESNIDTAHYVEPLTNVVAFYGPKMIDAKWSGVNPSTNVTMLDSASQQAASAGTAASGGIPETVSTVASTGSGGGAADAGNVARTAATGASEGPAGSPTGATTTSQGGDIDWAAIEGTLADIAPDVAVTENNTPQGSKVTGTEQSAYSEASDYYDYLDESAEII